MRRRVRAPLAVGLAAVFAGLVLGGAMPSGAYENVTVETCGSEGRCHGPISREVIVTIEGPDVVTTGETVHYLITVNGGPARRYGYFVLFIDPDGHGRNLAGDPLFHVEPNSQTRIESTNAFVLNFTAPRYAVQLMMRVGANSANGNSNPTGDAWGFAEKSVDVRFPVQAEAPYRSISRGTLPIAGAIIAMSLVGIAVFYRVSRRRIHQGGT